MTPIFSIITVNKNNRQGLQNTLNSVFSQYLNQELFECIVLDGASNDGSQLVIQQFSMFENFRAISENDKGVFDAMNKGISMAKGEWVIFMNSGDVFFLDQGLDLLSQSIHKSPTIDLFIMGFRYGNRDILPKKYSRIYHGMLTSHQSIVYKRKLLSKYLFDIHFPRSADYKQLYQILKSRVSFKIENNIFSVNEPYGTSSVNIVATCKEYFRIQRQMKLNIFVASGSFLIRIIRLHFI